MTPYSSDREKYNTGYLGWLGAYCRYWISLPVREIDELVEWLQATLAIFIYIVFVLTAPLTFPILTLFIMTQNKKKMSKDHGADKLKPQA